MYWPSSPFNGPLATAGLLYPRLPYRPQDLVHRLAAIHAGFMRNSG